MFSDSHPLMCLSSLQILPLSRSPRAMKPPQGDKLHSNVKPQQCLHLTLSGTGMTPGMYQAHCIPTTALGSPRDPMAKSSSLVIIQIWGSWIFLLPSLGKCVETCWSETQKPEWNINMKAGSLTDSAQLHVLLAWSEAPVDSPNPESSPLIDISPDHRDGTIKMKNWANNSIPFHFFLLM